MKEAKDIQAFLAPYIESGEENEKIEFKQELSLATKQQRAEFARDISAIANTPGNEGYLVIGVIDARKRPANRAKEYIVGFTCPDKDELYRQMMESLNEYIYPVPKISLKEFVYQPTEKKISVIVIAKSYARPHFIRKTCAGIEANDIYIRRGSACAKANPHEIEQMYKSQRQIIIVNFTHPLTEDQLQDIRRELNCIIQRIIECRVQFDHERSFAEQAREVVDKVDLNSREWQSAPIAVCLPGLSEAAVTILAEIHGRSGHFPTIIRRKPVTAEGATHYEFTEAIDLAAIRDNSRAERR